MPFVPKNQAHVSEAPNENDNQEDRQEGGENVEEMISEFQQLYMDLKEHLQESNGLMEVVQDETPLDYHQIEVQEENPYAGAF